MATLNPRLHVFGPATEQFGMSTARIIGEKSSIRVFSAWISEMGNFQNTCKLVSLATKLLREIPYVRNAVEFAEGLERAGSLFEKLRDVPAITYFADRFTQIVSSDPTGKTSKKDLRFYLDQAKDLSDGIVMGILTVNIFSPIFKSSLGERLMKGIDFFSLPGDGAEFGRCAMDWYQGKEDDKKGSSALFYFRMSAAFLSATACLGKVLNATLKKEVAPPLVLTIASAASTSFKLYVSYSEYTKPDKVKIA